MVHIEEGRSARLRQFFARFVALKGAATDPRIERAFAATRREVFALRVGGRLLFPLHATGGFGGMLKVVRPDAGMAWPASFVSPAGFIACEGVQDSALGRRLAAAFERRDWHRVQTLRIDGAPDETCWVAGEGWWLSTGAATELER